MLPIYFGALERPLFGAYHSPQGPRARPAGVVLASPFGHEELHAHRAERHLAERLALAGFPTLRFDYDATGDSAGDDRESGRVSAWRASLVSAVSELRSRAGVDKIAVVGLRAGALLALSIAAETEIDRFVLWNPVVSGRAHFRELTRLHKMLIPRQKGEEAKGDDEEALGFALRKDTIADFGKLDAAAGTFGPVASCLVIGGNDNPTEDKLLDKLRSLGATAEYRHLPGHPFLVTDPHKSDVPNEMLDAVVEYLSAAYPTGVEVPAPSSPMARGTVITRGPGAEQAWQMDGPRPRFGILTPAKKDQGKPAIILMNAGSIHHVGPNRSFVRMARRWADLGYPVLRMDLSGIGESPVHEGCVENVPYPRDAVSDARAAMTALASEGVASRFILSGLCSGADIAFRTGAVDERVAGAWMINPQAFYFPSSDALKEFMHAELQASYYESAFWDPERWKRMVRGEVNVARIAGVMKAKVHSSIKRRLGRFLGETAKVAETPEARDVISDLRSMAKRGADTFLLCSEDDPGLLYLLKYFGKELDSLDGLPGYRKEIVKNTDHTFTPLWSQDMLSDLLTAHLLKVHP